ncbi:MAG: QueT transporter family protein [Candidatus Bathyarchaeota archaeon]|nr:QueT transporter family protein [Candidatus Bathyarchaeota archaeon]
MKINTKDLAITAVFAALYAALVYVFTPISFLALQFRVAGILRPAIARKWILSIGYAIGVAVGNFFSPFGAYDLLFMPTMSLAAGFAGYLAAKPLKNNYFATGAVIATIIPLSVSWMLNQILGLPILATLPYLFISEQIICLVGATVFTLIEKRFKWWQT